MVASSIFKCSDCGKEMTGDEKLLQVGKMGAFGLSHYFVKLCDRCEKKRTKSYIIFAVTFLTVFIAFIYWFCSKHLSWYR